MVKKPTGKPSRRPLFPASDSDSLDSSPATSPVKKPSASPINGQKPKKKQSRSLLSPSSSSHSTSSASVSSRTDDSFPSTTKSAKKHSLGSNKVVIEKHSMPSVLPIGSNDEVERASESENESTDEEFSEDSGSIPANANSQPHPRESDIEGGRQPLKVPCNVSSDLQDREEDEEEVDSSSDSEQQLQSSLSHKAANAEGKKAATPTSDTSSSSEDESNSSSDPDTTVPIFKVSARKKADTSLKQVISKPADISTIIEEKIPSLSKRSAASHTEASGKRRKSGSAIGSEDGHEMNKQKITQSSEDVQKTDDIAGVEGGQDKKEITRLIWRKSDELNLLRQILMYKEQHHIIPSAQVILNELKSENHSFFASATLAQMNNKIRSMKFKYNNIYKNAKGASISHLSKLYDDGIALWSKIWGPEEGEAALSDDNGKTERKKENTNEEQGRETSLTLNYPFLSWHCKSIHGNNAIAMQSYMSPAKAKILENKCKKLEMSEIQLHIQKTKLLPLALKLIDDAIAKL